MAIEGDDFERRKTDRFTADLVVAVKSAWGNPNPNYHLSRDISQHGVFVLDDHPPEVDADLSMEFCMPTKGMHLTRYGEIFYGWTEGRVIRVDDRGYAVLFEDEYQVAIPSEARTSRTI